MEHNFNGCSPTVSLETFVCAKLPSSPKFFLFVFFFKIEYEHIANKARLPSYNMMKSASTYVCDTFKQKVFDETNTNINLWKHPSIMTGANLAEYFGRRIGAENFVFRSALLSYPYISPPL